MPRHPKNSGPRISPFEKEAKDREEHRKMMRERAKEATKTGTSALGVRKDIDQLGQASKVAREVGNARKEREDKLKKIEKEMGMKNKSSTPKKKKKKSPTRTKSKKKNMSK